MIDCLWNLEVKGHNPYVRFLVSVSRDNKMVVWKIFNGKTMHTDLALPLFFANQESKWREKPLITYRSGIKIEQVDSSNEDIESNNQNYISKKKNQESRSSIWLLSIHKWYFNATPVVKKQINK